MKVRAGPRILLAATALLLASCASSGRLVPGSRFRDGAPPAYPAASFVVFSDPHLYDPAAFPAGSGEEDASGLAGPSAEILDAAIGIISGLPADFVLVTGDLSQDGELADHLAFARRLEALRAGGKRVYVIPGNHDVKDGAAHFSMLGDAIPAPSVGPEEFARIYSDFGYGEALSRASDSLSYEAEPLPGLTLLALDDNRWRENPPAKKAITGGRLTAATLAWLESRLSAAAASGRAVIVAQHHEILEHWRGQKAISPDYIIEGADDLAALYSRWGARLAFTGHYHAQDAAILRRADGSFVCDASTGSLVNYPCPIRVVRIDGGFARFRTVLVPSIASRPEGFLEKARAVARDGAALRAGKALRRAGAWPSLAAGIADRAAEDFLAHYPGGPSKGVDRLWSQASPLEAFSVDLSLGLMSD